MIATNVRRLAVYLLLAFASSAAASAGGRSSTRPTSTRAPENPQVIAARRSALRGTIFDASGAVLASSAVIDGVSRRTYTDPAFSHLIGYASLRFGDHRARTRVGRHPDRPRRPESAARPPQRHPRPPAGAEGPDAHDRPAAAGLRRCPARRRVGAVVAIDPRTGAVLAMTSTPTFDATPIAGVPDHRRGCDGAITGTPGNPLIDRAARASTRPARS